MNKKVRLKLSVCLGMVILLAVLVFLSSRSRPYQILELKALDLRFALRGDRPVGSLPVVHVDIDDQSLLALGRWPWPRHYHAQITDILKECGAGSILMDVLFTEKDGDNPGEDLAFAQSLARTGITYLPFYFSQERPGISPALRALLLKDFAVSLEDAAKTLGTEAGDLKGLLPVARKAILDEIAHDLVAEDPQISFDGILQKIEQKSGWFLFPEDEMYLQERYAHQLSARAFINKFSRPWPPGSWPFQDELRQPCPPIGAYVEHIKGSGFINAEPDMDGVTRRIPLFIRHEGHVFPQLTVSALLDWLDVDRFDIAKDHVLLRNAHVRGGVQDVIIPVDRNGCMLINWAGRWETSFDHVSFKSILQIQQVRDQIRRETDMGLQAPGALAYLHKSEKELLGKLAAMVRGKMCIIGLTATGTNDLHPVPLQENYPMVGAHSNLVNTVLTGKFIVKIDAGARFFLLVLTALVVAGSSLLKLWKSFLLAFGYGVAYFLAALFLFVHFGVWVDLVGPAGVLVFGFAMVTSYRFFTEEKEKLWIKQAFSHYLSNEVISELMEDPGRLKLGGERREITVFFSDVRGFTAFSESRQPEEVVGMLNEILTEQVEVVFRHGGTLDKFVGDELMAFFGAPGARHAKDHALVAVRVAVEIQAKMRRLQAKRVAEQKPPLQIGIGINTGEMVVGNMGSAVRMDYTVIGDNVNLAARLCSAAGKDEIIISETTYNMVAEHVRADKLAPVTVKGKANPVAVYRVTGLCADDHGEAA